MKAPFGVGDLVICIEDAGINGADITIKRGTILSIREVIPENFPVTSIHYTRELGLRFHGHKNNYLPGTDFEVTYMARKFRLYEPPKPEQSTNKTVKPVSVS